MAEGDIWSPENKYKDYLTKDDIGKSGETVLYKRSENCNLRDFKKDVDAQSLKTNLPRKEQVIPKETVIALYQRLESFLKHPDYKEELRKELEKSNPHYLKQIKKRMQDLEKSDHGIVIAGETSAGKTTLVNKLLGKRMFDPQVEESTSTICKIRNSSEIKIVEEPKIGPKVEHVFTDKWKSEPTTLFQTLRKTLRTTMDLTISKIGKRFQSVDVGFPIPFLKGDSILVDTPGIGGSGEVTEKMMEYLPNAVSFVFVINVGSAGGLQKDRLPKILNRLTVLTIENEMPCFDPEDVIFVTNKWDNIKSDDEDEDEDPHKKDKLWRDLKTNLKDLWPSLKEDNIFRLNLIEVSQKQRNQSTEEFLRFRKTLEANIEKAHNMRAIKHFRYWKEIIGNISRGLSGRLCLNRLSQDEHKKLAQTHQEKIEILNTEREEIGRILQKRTQDMIDRTVKEFSKYMETNEGKDRILNPSGLEHVMKVVWDPFVYKDTIESRIRKSTARFLRSEDVSNRFKEIKNDALKFYSKVCAELSVMENERVKESSDREEMLDDDSDGMKAATKVSTAGDVVLTSLASVTVAGILVLGVIFSPVVIPVAIYKNTDSQKKELIDEIYEKHKRTIPDKMRNKLKSTWGNILEALISKITSDVLFRKLEFEKEMTDQLLKSRMEILQDQATLVALKKRVDEMEDGAAFEL